MQVTNRVCIVQVTSPIVQDMGEYVAGSPEVQEMDEFHVLECPGISALSPSGLVPLRGCLKYALYLAFEVHSR
jgi:hypothetical protein